ncbi:MAG: hypothetical protein NTY19_04225 [Planctomycetota bacterium]|nr:hypothetical protein [Planctomycetota bacterium]
MPKRPKKPQPDPDPLFGSPPTRPARPGREPKVPDNLQDCLADLQKHTEAWIRRSNDVWFTSMPDLTHAWAKGTPTYEGVVEQYEEAIDALKRLAFKVRNGIASLKNGKATAEEKLADERTPPGKQKPTKKPSSPPEPTEDTDYFGLKDGKR